MMQDRLIKILANRFAAAIAMVLTAVAAGYFGVEQAQAKDAANNVAQPLTEIVGLMFAGGLNLLIAHLQANRAGNAEQTTEEIVVAMEYGKTVRDTVIDLSTPAVKQSMSLKTRGKVREIRQKTRRKNKGLQTS